MITFGFTPATTTWLLTDGKLIEYPAFQVDGAKFRVRFNSDLRTVRVLMTIGNDTFDIIKNFDEIVTEDRTTEFVILDRTKHTVAAQVIGIGFSDENDESAVGKVHLFN